MSARLDSLRTRLGLVLRAPTGIAGVILLILFAAIAVIGPALWGDTAVKVDADRAYEGPGPDAWLGTDSLGRDVLARTLASTRLSLELALCATAIAVVIGVPFGIYAGIAGRRVRGIMGRIVGLGLAIPGLLVALVMVTVITPGALAATVATGVATAPAIARTAQNAAIGVRDEEFVQAARTMGVGRLRLIRRHILPNMAETIVLQIGIVAQLALVMVAALSFLGLGVQAPKADWGRALNEGLDALYTAPLAAVVPGVAVFLAGLMFAFLGEAVARSLNVDLRHPSRGRSSSLGATQDASSKEHATTTGIESGGNDPVVDVRSLNVGFDKDGQYVPAVTDVSLRIEPGEIVGVVGESGSGKSMLARAIAGLSPIRAQVSAERLLFGGADTQTDPPREVRRRRATELAVVFQDPMSSLNPSMRIGRQLTEKVRVHLGMNTSDASALAVDRLDRVGLTSKRQQLRNYPHEFSGGMRQRIMIAMGLMAKPTLLIADEPTTALDVSVQAQILDLLRSIRSADNTAILFISHNLAVVSELCTRVVVMYGGRIMEVLESEQLANPRHPYTQALMRTIVDLRTDREQTLEAIQGQQSRAQMPVHGCPFAPRCPEATDVCTTSVPDLVEQERSGHRVACWARPGTGERVRAGDAERVNQ